MSRAVLIIALARVLQRQPTPEEYEIHRLALLESCPEGRMHIPSKPQQDSLLSDACDLRANGWSIRRIARTLHMSKSAVHRQLSQSRP